MTGRFCCDGLVDCNPVLTRTPQQTCLAKCAVTAGCVYATTTRIPGKPPGCLTAKTCAKQGVYKDTPSPADIQTWRRGDV